MKCRSEEIYVIAYQSEEEEEKDAEQNENEKKEGKVKSEEEEGKGFYVILDNRFSLLLFLICGNEII